MRSITGFRWRAPALLAVPLLAPAAPAAEGARLYRDMAAQVLRRIFPEESVLCHLVLIGLPLAALSVFWLLPLPIALPAFLAIGAATAAFYWYLYQGNSRPVLTGAEEMQRATGKVLGVNGPVAQVWVRSELWSARYEGELREGDLVQVVAMDGLRLKVRKVAVAQAAGARTEANYAKVIDV